MRVVEDGTDAAAGGDRPGRLAALLAAAPENSTVVRCCPSPLVRDTASGGRSGHLDLVFGGDFDLIFAVED